MDKLIRNIRATGAPIALGLDTRIEYLPPEFAANFDLTTLEGAAAAITEFNKQLIARTCDILPAVKVQIAYYEMYGLPGLHAFRETLRWARRHALYTIADVKRGDIGATSAAYSTAYLGQTVLEQPMRLKAFAADSATINPYLGEDGVLPFVEDCKKYDKEIFVLIKTSNPSSAQIQDLHVYRDDDCGERLYQVVGDLVSDWGKDSIGQLGYSRVGGVVGATHPEQGAALRLQLPQTFFLLPGYGAQGATAQDLVGCFDREGGGAIVNASRSLICAWKQHEDMHFADACRLEIQNMQKDIADVLSQAGKVRA